MTQPDDDLRASLHDPTLDAGISAGALLDGVRQRGRRLHRRRRNLRTAAAAVAAVVVVGGAALLVPGPDTPTVQPARQPSPPVVSTAPVGPTPAAPAPAPALPATTVAPIPAPPPPATSTPAPPTR